MCGPVLARSKHALPPGVPRVGNDWGACDPDEPRNRRLRCSVLLERVDAGGVTRVLVDTGPDLREQLLAAEVNALDGVPPAAV